MAYRLSEEVLRPLDETEEYPGERRRSPSPMRLSQMMLDRRGFSTASSAWTSGTKLPVKSTMVTMVDDIDFLHDGIKENKKGIRMLRASYDLLEHTMKEQHTDVNEEVNNRLGAFKDQMLNIMKSDQLDTTNMRNDLWQLGKEKRELKERAGLMCARVGYMEFDVGTDVD
mmetsp:Transcript_13072/g.14391  ORF Transcript_13072/g.14391 Transcript_13072/m.14391 type:complete len:170 (+) Transcript_13072:88-597(+)